MRYFFHVRLHNRLLPDEAGCQFVDEAAARSEATRIARELASEISGDPNVPGVSAVEVSDCANTPLFAISVPPELQTSI